MIKTISVNGVENIYTSVACNRRSGTFDWGQNGYVVFAASNAVAILDPNYNKTSSKIVQTFIGHTDLVSTVKWIRNWYNLEDEIISGSTDGSCIIWKLEKLNLLKKYELHGHLNSVAVVDSFYYSKDKAFTATASNDATIKLWTKDPIQDEYICTQTIELNHLCLAMKCCTLKNECHNILMAIALDDSSIRLFVKNVEENSSAHLLTEVQRLLGHEDWIRSLDIKYSKDGKIHLASGSQDTFIRLWKIEEIGQTENQSNNLLTIEEKTFTIHSKTKTEYRVVLESVLSGHDAWVTEVQWSKSNDELSLLSSSIDKSLVIWTPLDAGGTWMEKVRVGDVGGNSLGFLGGQFAPDSLSILGLGFQGSFQLWHQFEQDDNHWLPSVVVSGHFNEVRDISWEPKGQFLISVSADQTTRLHCPWIRDDFPETWHELARPQVHGYDMQAIIMLGRYKFASCAEEKIVRTFNAPSNFVENLKTITLVIDDEGKQIIASEIKGASVPSLGLSNKGVSSTDEKNRCEEESLNYFSSMKLFEPPTEVTLMQNTLWPETQKLYGHGYDLYAICATSNGNLLASSCKATISEDAYIILWDTKTWKQIQKLYSHQLTVTQMRFSPNNKFLLSVSRDRRWTLFENIVANDGTYNFQCIACTDKKNGIHSRIIWTCDWSNDSKWFATASRDGKIIAWHKTDENTKTCLGYYNFLDILDVGGNNSITALAISPIKINVEHELVALGNQNGIIYLYLFNKVWTHLYTIDQSFAHHKTIKRLTFRPAVERQQLASCGEDNILRIYEIVL